MRRLGIDEAGRGCVLGSLVVAGFFVDDVGDSALVEAGAADSKTLSPARRTAARTLLEPLGTAIVKIIPATAIDGGNMDRLEEHAIAEILREARADHVVIDALGAPLSLPLRLVRLAQASGYAGPIHCAPKADRDHPIVGAASVFAKTTRDALLAALDPHQVMGSGYPSDPVTRRWLSNMIASGTPWPSFVRTRWGTLRQGNLWS